MPLSSRRQTAKRRVVLLRNYLSLIGGAVFSAGAGGRTGVAPSFCACGSGRAGWGAGVVGRFPPGFDWAGVLSSFGGAGGPCNGGVACATCELSLMTISASE